VIQNQFIIELSSFWGGLGLSFLLSLCKFLKKLKIKRILLDE